MSTTVIASLVSILAVVLPYFGVQVGTDELTAFLQGLVVVVSSLWIWYRRVKSGDINMIGVRK